ncbi:hypothetical protein [Shewanella algae]|uniref:hypothetical protein n=1 Tax=Shewanella algae TaxID=38313 RepID=UPI0031F5512F
MNGRIKSELVTLVSVFCLIFYADDSFGTHSETEIEGSGQNIFHSKHIKTPMELGNFREEGSFYLLESSIGEDVCTNVLESINQPREYNFFKNKDGVRKEESRFANFGLPEMMIQTQLNVPRTVMSKKNASSFRVEEFVVDLDKDGETESIYRTTGYLSGVWVHNLFMLPLPYDSKKYLNIDSFWKEQQELGNVSKFFLQWKEFQGLEVGDYLRTLGSQVIYELIEFHGNYYIFATSSVIKENSSVKVAVIKLDDIGVGYPACLFETKFIVTY